MQETSINEILMQHWCNQKRLIFVVATVQLGVHVNVEWQIVGEKRCVTTQITAAEETKRTLVCLDEYAHKQIPLDR